MNYDTISIREIITMMNSKEIYLPEIQRDFVWKQEQVEKLFESVFVGYPIGTLLFWKTTKKMSLFLYLMKLVVTQCQKKIIKTGVGEKGL